MGSLFPGSVETGEPRVRYRKRMGLKSLLHHHSLGAALGTAAPLLAAASHPIGGGGLILLPPPLFSLPPACPSHFRHRLPPLLPSPPFLRICWDQRRKRGQMAGGLVGGSGGGGGGLNPTVVRFVLVVMALGLAGYIVGPPLYWHLAEALGRSSACPLCAPCDCSAQPLLSLPQGAPPSPSLPLWLPCSDLMMI